MNEKGVYWVDQPFFILISPLFYSTESGCHTHIIYGFLWGVNGIYGGKSKSFFDRKEVVEGADPYRTDGFFSYKILEIDFLARLVLWR